MTSQLTRRRALQGMGIALSALQSSNLLARTGYPSRPVSLIVPVPPGGVIDTTVRQLISHMPASFGQPIVAENRAGGMFAVAMNAINKAAADGYTIIHLNAAMLSTQVVTKQFDVFASLVPVAGLGATDITISTSGKHNFPSVAALIEHIKAHPGKVVYASPGIGTLEHLSVSKLVRQYGLDVIHVPVKNSVEAVQMMVKGEADFGTAPIPFNIQFGASGRLKALCVLNHRRNPALPDLPTIKEAGLVADRLTIWGGLAAPKGTPAQVIAHIEQSVAAAMKTPELLKAYRGAGLEPEFETAQEFGQTWRDDWGWISAVASGPLLK